MFSGIQRDLCPNRRNERNDEEYGARKASADAQRIPGSDLRRRRRR